jgi:hypothetical protein
MPLLQVQKNNSKNFKLLGFCISESDDAESDSDEEELERLMCSNAEDQPGTSTSPSLPTIQEEINPFAIDFTVEVNNLSIEACLKLYAFQGSLGRCTRSTGTSGIAIANSQNQPPQSEGD